MVFWGAKRTINLEQSGENCLTRQNKKRRFTVRTIRVRAHGYVLSGDSGSMFVIGHHSETVLGELLQSSHGVGQCVHIQILMTEERYHRYRLLMAELLYTEAE